MTAEQQEKIYTAFHGKVMGYLCARINRRADAEDLCSEVFEKIFNRFDQYDKTKSSISTWVFTITRNTLIDHYRRSKPQEELDEEITADATAEHPELSEDGEPTEAGTDAEPAGDAEESEEVDDAETEDNEEI